MKLISIIITNIPNVSFKHWFYFDFLITLINIFNFCFKFI